MTVEPPRLPPPLPPPVGQAASADPAAAPPTVPRTTGVVFVHGIGTQVARETLFDWARPILDVLTTWRRERDELGLGPVGENPVGSASVSDPDNPWIEVDIPAAGARAREQWLLTEAYWAGDIRAPSFTDAIGYVMRRVRGIIRGIAEGYGVREPRRLVRLNELLEANEGNPDPIVQERVTELRRSLGRRWKIVDGLDSLWQPRIVRGTLSVVASAAALLALAIYAPLRAIPISAISRKVEQAALDTFLISWFGDLPIILDDAAQSAAIRTRLVERVAWLRARGCRDVVLVAHSGGTVVSYMTLLRYSQEQFPVTKLITFGEAIQLAWRLEREAGDWVAGNPLRGDLTENRPGLRWIDIWASYDPAPSGQLVGVPGSPLVAVQSLADEPDDPRIHVESRPVTNYMHLALDHGGYWTNDEGFLIPLIRHLDDPAGDGSASRFFGNSLDRTIRTERRRRRVSILLAWRWSAFLLGLLALGVAWWSSVDLATVGHSVAGVWGLLPAHQLVSGPISGIGNAVDVICRALGVPWVSTGLAGVGPLLLGVAVPLAAVFLVYRRGVASWTAHDAIERAAIRRERFPGPGRRSARSEGILLAGGLGAVVLAAAAPGVVTMLGYLALVALVAAVARVRG
ncbi:MAG TPA: hypothetical protein VFK35_04535 [Candidatus Limnocylindrales bacterium]|nr:hypothetical protein [Candidatus Limnocylindrales bacterium]